ncbi:phage neck terminator protein [Paraburkholderia sediminicola]|uniref:phage neck terminator protein n=1 Tax=Paraburkholderia sediminicola TaxID=458836 RepID=UPI0038B9198F
MANDSTQSGYLVPTAPSPPLEDAALDAVFQQMIVGLTNLPGNMVRPRWQATVPKQPDPSVNWCAIGVTNSETDANPVITHNPGGNGSDTLLRNEVLTVLASFYGPNASANASQARDGLFVAQNNDMLTTNLMGLVDVGRKMPAPELVNQQWIRRFDFEIRVRRQIVRTFNILNILSAQATVDSDTLTEPINVSQ